MRARNLKPGYFTNEELAIADPIYGHIFQGLWCMAGREGRLEDRPAKIHMSVNPGRAFETTERSLAWLAEKHFILRYEAQGLKLIQVLMFWKHQNPHHKEPPSKLPPPEASPGFDPHASTENPGFELYIRDESPGHAQGEPRAGPGSEAVPRGVNRADSGFRIPDSPPYPPPGGGNGAQKRTERKPREVRNTSASAWDQVTRAVRIPSTRSELEVRDPRIREAVRLLGGWNRLGQMPENRMGEFKAPFREHYEQLLEGCEREGLPA